MHTASPQPPYPPTPPPSHGGPARVSPGAAARVARARATGEPPRGPPTWRRMPCKARSVPEGHTAETAYLTIPPLCEHGLVLACSHPECRASGKRFRFCAICDLPVAKRNFLKRHSHDLGPGGQAGAGGEMGEEEEAAGAAAAGAAAAGGGAIHGGGSIDGTGSASADGHGGGGGGGRQCPVVSSDSEASLAAGAHASSASSPRSPPPSSSAVSPGGPSAPTSRSAFSSHNKRPREAGTTPPRDSDLDRDGTAGGAGAGGAGAGSGSGLPPHPGSYHSAASSAAAASSPPPHHAMSWPPPGAAEGQGQVHPQAGAQLSPYGTGGRGGYPPQHPGQGGGGGGGGPPHFSPGMHAPPPPPYGYPPPPTSPDYAGAAGPYRGPPSLSVGSPDSRATSTHSAEFEPPPSDYSVMRLSRREREWIQLLRTRPSARNTGATNDWVNKCLSYSEPMAEQHDGTGGGVETVWRGGGGGREDSRGSEATEIAKNGNGGTTVVSPAPPHDGPGVPSSGAANVSNDTSGTSDDDHHITGMDRLDLSPCRRNGGSSKQSNAGNSLSTMSMGDSVVDLLDSAGLMMAADLPMVADPGEGGASVSSDVSPIHDGFPLRRDTIPPIPSLDHNLREKLQQAKSEGERAASRAGRTSRAASPHVGADTPTSMYPDQQQQSWGCSFLPPLCGAFNS